MASKLLTDTAKKPPNAGKGRPKGARNKVTADLRAMLAGALDDVGGQKYLAQQARENPAAFLTLIGKTLPKEVTGKDGSPLIPCKFIVEFI